MKKFIALLAASSLIFLFGCNDSDVAGDMSLADIFAQSIEAMEELDSYAMEMEVEQQVDIGEEESMTVNMSTVSEVNQNPMLLFQTISMDMFGETISYESYFSEEHGFFMEDPMMGGWAKYPDSLVSEMMDIEAQMSPEDQLKPFLDHISDLSFTTEDDSYVIKLVSEDVDIQELFEQMSGILGSGLGEMDEMMGAMTIEELDYEIVIDKNTLYQTEATVRMVMSMDIMGETMSTIQNMNITLNKFNEVESNVIPEDVLNNAVEMSEEDLFGF